LVEDAIRAQIDAMSAEADHDPSGSDILNAEPVSSSPAAGPEALAAARRRLLEQRIRGEAKPAPRLPAIVRRGGGPAYPMSFTQERLWFLDQLEPGNPMYNIALAELVSARIDVPTLERALAEIVRRHEGLRTVF